MAAPVVVDGGGSDSSRVLTTPKPEKVHTRSTPGPKTTSALQSSLLKKKSYKLRCELQIWCPPEVCAEVLDLARRLRDLAVKRHIADDDARPATLGAFTKLFQEKPVPGPKPATPSPTLSWAAIAASSSSRSPPMAVIPRCNSSYIWLTK